MNAAAPPVPAAVLEAWALHGAALAPLGSGLINRTWLATQGGRRFVLQQLNPIFPAEVNQDIDAVTAHLAASGLPTPRVLPTGGGQLWQCEQGAVWRLLSHVEGIAHDRATEPALAAEAGRLLGRFHRALAGFEHRFAVRRAGVHDLPRHLQVLRDALEQCRQHPEYPLIEPLGQRILAQAAALAPLPEGLPLRIVHGDPKLNNLLFDPQSGQALCLVDLDTLGRMPVIYDLGDAFRSWCNPVGEDGGAPRFSLPLLAAAAGGYAEMTRDWLEPAEWAPIVPATLSIMIELAARFCADALYERYFGWDPARYPGRSAHNRARAANQLALYTSLQAQQAEAQRAVEAAFLPHQAGSSA